MLVYIVGAFLYLRAEAECARKLCLNLLRLRREVEQEEMKYET